MTTTGSGSAYSHPVNPPVLRKDSARTEATSFAFHQMTVPRKQTILDLTQVTSKGRPSRRENYVGFTEYKKLAPQQATQIKVRKPGPSPKEKEPPRAAETNSKQEGRYGVVRATGDGRSWSYELKRAVRDGAYCSACFFNGAFPVTSTTARTLAWYGISILLVAPTFLAIFCMIASLAARQRRKKGGLTTVGGLVGGTGQAATASGFWMTMDKLGNWGTNGPFGLIGLMSGLFLKEKVIGTRKQRKASHERIVHGTLLALSRPFAFAQSTPVPAGVASSGRARDKGKPMITF
ncbi:hypothetical protein MGG_15574 [Pyricularia oryzae 70-15]|uniref:Uncharacterized protein n=3 Tax=Pyricularia oryzae TaxID=318829 RepID=G4MTU2_PYRO7|nr:uncharacterized protein MGG_15574 [Pyricularia oryzae 70-15]EHA53931.1 hypothetical protein MGG_15574 [Pyricularia oryzae 70-15]ELQ42725.1 hypothetical protein OOU_Y34scaffold00194g38 [Pyricularia oryzae Y34]